MSQVRSLLPQAVKDIILGRNYLTRGPRGGGGGGGEGAGGYSTKFYTRKCSPEVQPLTLLYTIFDRKGTPFVYLPLTKGIYPFHMPSLERCIPFNCCKCTVFRI